MWTQLVWCVLFYFTSVSLAFPGYFEDDDEDEKHYADQYHKYTTRKLTPTPETAEPTVETAQTHQRLPVFTPHAGRDPPLAVFTPHAEHDPLRQRRHNMPDPRPNIADHDQIKQLLGGEFMHPITWIDTETRFVESETHPLPQDMQHFLTSVTASRTPDPSHPARVHTRTYRKQLNLQEKEMKKLTPQRRPGLYPFLTRRLGLIAKPERRKLPNEEAVTPTMPFSTTAALDDLRTVPLEGSYPAIARQGDPLAPSSVLPIVLPTIKSTITTELDYNTPQSLQDIIIQTSPVVTTPLPHFTVQGSQLPVKESGSSEGVVIARGMELSTLPQSHLASHPMQVMVNGTMMDWRQAVALRKGEYFDMKQFWRDGGMTTKRSRVYVFVTQGKVYRVCVLQDYKSLIISCSIDNAMTICIKGLYVTNKIFENEQGVRYNGSIVPCPTIKKLRPGQVTEALEGIYTQICVNRRRTEFKIRCPPEGAHWTSQTRCVDNFRRAPWRGPFDYMFGEAWVGTTVSCPVASTTEQRYFYITMTCATTSYPILDVEGLLALVANLTYDYEEDLVAKLNKSLYIFLSPPTTHSLVTVVTTPPTTVPDYTEEYIEEGAEVARCYHCGMDETEIPYSAACNDAFANEIMELMPVDARARAQLSGFRKYCRYMDQRDWSYNESDIRSVYGKWTGGCSVRWVDISVVYTERTCRNKDRPAQGHSFASKRMAKLELALKSIDSGCITSPMAVLLPLSRAISLFARFHACVCQGHFCNVATMAARAQWPALLTALVLSWCRF